MKIVAVKKDTNDTITHYQTDTGSVIDHAQAVTMVRSGELEGYNVGKARNGVESIRSYPDGDPSNNLDNLPTFQ